LTTDAALDAFRADLASAADGLRYLSEADHPFDAVAFPGAGADALNPDRVAQLVGSTATDVEEVPLDRFFAGMIENADPADPVGQALVPRYKALRDTLRQRMPDVRVFRLGRTDMDCYVLGTFPGGGIAGLHTTALET
jgi:hypothetical protein